MVVRIWLVILNSMNNNLLIRNSFLNQSIKDRFTFGPQAKNPEIIIEHILYIKQKVEIEALRILGSYLLT